MAVTFCIDFGNTRKKLAVFNDNNLAETILLPDDSDAVMRELIGNYNPAKSILSSVIDHNPALEDLLATRSRFHKLGYNSKLPVTSPVGKPETIGADRLALAAGAVHFYPRKNNLVIGLGTCVTYNFINKYNEFLGGGISPGLEMRLKSLNHFTAKLPLIAAGSNVPLMGYDTETNILSGVILGMANEIDGFIDAYGARYDNFNVVLTGGDIAHLGAHLKNKIFADPDLIFKGLYAISEVNNP
jgi:type III pantothenate kinase